MLCISGFGCSCAFVGFVHFLTHRTYIIIFFLVVMKIFFTEGFVLFLILLVLLFIKSVVLHISCQFLFFQIFIVFFASVTGIGSNVVNSIKNVFSISFFQIF